MKVYNSKELKTIVHETLDSENIVKERFIIKYVDEYVSSEENRNVLCLYGLRRTGKTVMLMQEIRKLDDYDNVLFIRCDGYDTIGRLRGTIDTVLQDNPGCRKVFIDEVTKVDGFIDYGSFLADDYSARGIRVVLSGTDLLSFLIASNSELYDRVDFLHTTYIPFKEYNYLLGKNLDEYISYGGTLSKSGAKNAFYDADNFQQYTNSAIVENILHTLQRWNSGDNVGYDVLRYFINNNCLASAINKVLEYHSHSFESSQINRPFKAHDWGSVPKFMNEPSDETEIREILRDPLGIQDYFDEQTIDFITDYLVKLDVLYKVPKVLSLDSGNNDRHKVYLFTQVGMRYCQAFQQMKALSLKADTMHLEKLESDIRGQILEDVVLYQLLKDNPAGNELIPRREISHYRSEKLQGAEIGIIVLDRDADSVVAMEVKHSDKTADGQRKQLVREDISADIERITGRKIVNRVVLYRGENTQTKDGVLYINVNDFLINSQEMLQVLLDNPSLITSLSLD